jgi:hypothetical protein
VPHDGDFYRTHDDDAKSDDHLQLQPIIAWSIKHAEDEGLFVLPITATGNVAQSELWAIKTPDGTFETVYGGTADTEEQTLQTLKQTAEHIRKQQAEHDRQMHLLAVSHHAKPAAFSSQPAENGSTTSTNALEGQSGMRSRACYRLPTMGTRLISVPNLPKMALRPLQTH